MIETTQDLKAFCQDAARSVYITIDTEFARTKTYWPELCLVQIAHDHGAAIIDPMAAGIDLAPLWDLILADKPLKVFHAARQDLEIIYHQTGKIPQAIFDTQIAGMVCGFGDSVGYDHLVKKITGTQIDKSSRFTDWKRRPLSQKQFDYALSDVTFLRNVYEKMEAMLTAENRHSWLDEEIAILRDPHTYFILPEDAWQKVKVRSSNRRFLNRLKYMAAWREELALELDRNRGRIMTDALLLEIIADDPKDLPALQKLLKRHHHRPFNEEQFAGMMTALEKAAATSDDDLPSLPKKKSGLSDQQTELADLLKSLLRMKANEMKVAPRLIANSDDIEKLVRYHDKAEIHTLTGWRLDAFGRDALAFLEGKLSLRIEENRAILA